MRLGGAERAGVEFARAGRHFSGVRFARSVIVTFPDALSGASYQDLEDYFELFLRKAKRRIMQTIMERADQTIPESLGGSGKDEAAN
jgi:hypothetical protein